MVFLTPKVFQIFQSHCSFFQGAISDCNLQLLLFKYNFYSYNFVLIRNNPKNTKSDHGGSVIPFIWCMLFESVSINERE